MNQFIFAATLGLMSTSFNAHALGNLADITIFDRIQNRTLPVYKHLGHYYVVGKPGNTYQINVGNRQVNSIEAVVSVDAVNVITGKTATASQQGYIYDAYDHYAIAGWRKNNDEVAGFYFTNIESAYATRTGRPSNVGVIGVAIYNKKQDVLQVPHISRDQNADETEPESSGQSQPQVRPQDTSTPSATASQETLTKSMPRRAAQMTDKSSASKKLGTGHGAIETSYVTEVVFERASTRPAEIITIYYDSYKNLVAQGVIKPKARKPLAKPFADEVSNGFVPDPS